MLELMRRQGAVHVRAPAATRLGQLGLDHELLERVLRGADAEARTYTSLDPPHMAGMARFSRTVRLLREELVPHGWTYDNPRNLARTVSPDRRVALVAASGDTATGVPEIVPSTRYERGVATAAAVNRNFVQQPLPIFSDGPDTDDEPATDEADGSADASGTTTWLLLYHVASDEIRAELSVPDSMVDGFIDTWIERILLPPVPIEPPPEVVPGAAPVAPPAAGVPEPVAAPALLPEPLVTVARRAG